MAFPWVVTSTGPVGFMVVCMYFMTGTPEGSTESVFMEKPGIEPATPGLQGYRLHNGSLQKWAEDSCLWSCSLAVPVLAGWFYGFVVLCPGTPKGSTSSGFGFKASQKTGQRLKVSSDRLGEAGNRTCDPWFTRHRFIPTPKKLLWLSCV